MRRDITVSWHSHGGWFLGHTVSTGHANVELRTAQYRASFDEAICLKLARGLVAAKVRNARTLLRRNAAASPDLDDTLVRLKREAEAAGRAPDLPALLGIEGGGGRRLFRPLFGDAENRRQPGHL